jgi:arginase
MGPSAIRYARLHRALAALGHEVADRGDVSVPVAETLEPPPSAARLRYLAPVASACRAVAREVEDAARRGAFPLVLGGDHSLAIGTLAGLRRALGEHGVLWLDAHGDFNTPETTPSGNIHGMPLAVATGRGAAELLAVSDGGPSVDEAAAALLAVRALDPGERETLRRSGVHVFTMKDIDQWGAAEAVRRALAAASGDGRRPVHVSCDLDAIDPVYAPGVGTPVPGGLTYREAHLAMELLADSGLVRSMEVVEVNPIRDRRNRTARLAVELIASILGQRIY